MNTDTGVILAAQQYEEEMGTHELMKPWKQVETKHLLKKVQMQLTSTGRSKVPRNSYCPCGSMKKFKRCCATS